MMKKSYRSFFDKFIFPTFDTKKVVSTFDTKVTDYLCSGWVFFLQTNFDFLTSHFDGIFLYHSKGIIVLSLNLKKIYFTCHCFSLSHGSLKIAILANLGQLTRYQCVSGDLIRLRNRSKLVKRIFAIIDLLQGAKFILLYFKWRVRG